MKKFPLLLIGYILTATLYSQTTCEENYLVNDEYDLEYAIYDANDNKQSSMIIKITETEENDDGYKTITETTNFDGNNNEIVTIVTLVICKNDSLYMEVSYSIPNSNTKPKLNISMDGLDNMASFSSDPSPGQKLPDYTQVNTSTINKIESTITTTVTDRLFEDFETITTSAGTFECIRYSEIFETKSTFNIVYKNIIWYSLDGGMVKHETYNKKGKLQRKTELINMKLI